MTKWNIDDLRDFFKVVLEKYPEPDERYTIKKGGDNDGPYRVGEDDLDDYRELISSTGHNLVDELVNDQKSSYKINSWGQTNLAHIPYIAVSDTDESERTEYGRYVLYLVDPVKNRVYLSLAIGAGKIKDFAAEINNRDKPERSPTDILNWISTWNQTQIEAPAGFEPGPIDFHDSLRRGDGYGSGTIYYKEYTLEDLPSLETLQEDLQNILEVYDDLIDIRVDNLNIELNDNRAWQVSTEGYRWTHWNDGGVVSIAHKLDLTEFKKDIDELSSINESSVRKGDGQGFAFQFVHEMSVGDVVIAARRRHTDPHTVHAIGKITATNIDKSDFDVPDGLEDDSHFHKMKWYDFGAEVPITLGKNIPLIHKTLTDLKPDDLTHVLGTTILYLVAAGQFESVAVASGAVTDATGLNIEVTENSELDSPGGVKEKKEEQKSTETQDTDPDQSESTDKRFSEAELMRPQFDRDPAKIELGTLHFENETDLLEECINALQDGNHLLLVGPPGTGKSDLAQILSEELVNESYELTTATADWSTFDTIGGYRQQETGELKFSPGVFLSRFQDENDRPANEWLIIDEFNRANIDKAFGSLFSVLTGDDVLLPFSEDKTDIQVYGSEPKPEMIIKSTDYVIPDDWRLIATMNTFDKSSLYDLSYALSRRFAYIHLPAPTVDKIDEPLVEKYIDCWDAVDPDPDRIEAVTELWKEIQVERPLGPAIIRDVLLAAETDLTRGVTQHVLPQFEGLMNRTQKDILEDIIETGHVKRGAIETFGQQYFGLTDWTADK